jgi:hypothetical protein
MRSLKYLAYHHLLRHKGGRPKDLQGGPTHLVTSEGLQAWISDLQNSRETIVVFVSRHVFGKTHRATMDVSDTLPDDIDALRALLLAERASRAAIVAERDKLVVRNDSG